MIVRLDVNLRLQALIDAVQAHQRRVADRFENVVTLSFDVFLDCSPARS